MTISKAPTATKEKQDISISWHSLDTNEVLEKLVTAHHIGLSSQEAEARLANYGLNQLVEAPRPTFLILAPRSFPPSWANGLMRLLLLPSWCSTP